MKIVNKIDYLLKNKNCNNLKIDFLFVSAHCTSFMKIWIFMREGGVCISLIGKSRTRASVITRQASDVTISLIISYNWLDWKKLHPQSVRDWRLSAQWVPINWGPPSILQCCDSPRGIWRGALTGAPMTPRDCRLSVLFFPSEPWYAHTTSAGNYLQHCWLIVHQACVDACKLSH